MTGDAMVMVTTAVVGQMKRPVWATIVLLWLASPLPAQSSRSCIPLFEDSVFRMSMRADSGIGYVDSPEVVRYQGEWWLLGLAEWHLFRRDGADTLGRVGGTSGGMRIGRRGIVSPVPRLPAPGDFPRAVVVDGMLEVMWGVRNSTVSADTIYSARWLDSSWGAPSIVGTGGEWRWLRARMGDIASRHDSLFVVAPGESDSMHVSLFTRAEGRWTERRILRSRFVGYAAVAATADELVLAAVVNATGVPSGERRKGQLVVLASPDGGESWLESQTLFASSTWSPFEPRLVANSGGVFLVWNVGPSGGAPSETVMLAVRRSGRWELQASLAVPEGFGNMTVTSDDDGGVVAALPTRNGVRLARWNGGRWCGATIDRPGVLPNPVIVPDGARFRAFWGQVRPLGTGAAFSSHTATIYFCC